VAGPVTLDARADRDNIPLALVGWVAGCTAIWSALFAEGNYLYGRMPQALFLTVVFLVSSAVLAAVIRRTWAAS
jgi:ABC-type thiamin/hydroxymethylpyrimidine transport system permease subunit